MKQRYEKLKAINKRIVMFVMFILAILTIIYLAEENLITMPVYVSNVLNFFLLFLITVSIINIILKFTTNRVYKNFEKELEIEQRIFLTKLYSLLWYIIGFSFLLYELGLELKDITIVLGLAATGLAFAVRDIIFSFFVWLIVLSKKPFRHEDIIEIGEDRGKVDRIGMFYITLRDMYDVIYKIPNKTFLEKTTRNYGPKNITITHKFPLNKYLTKKDFDKVYNFFKKEHDLRLEQMFEGKDLYIKFDIKTEFDKANEIKEKIFLDMVGNFTGLIIQKKKSKN